jgi:hypothetical protein
VSRSRYQSRSTERAPAPAKAGAGRFFSRAGWVLGVGCGALLVGATPGAEASRSEYRDGPPPGFSGGFGESTCQGCHGERELNEPGGKVVLEGVPEHYVAGQAYALTVTLTRTGIAVGGFELTARFEQGGAQAGTLSVPPDAAGRVAVAKDRDVEYAHQRQTGSELVAPDTARWTVSWTAPAQGGTVQFNVAANAANLDDSTSGDFIYTAVEKAAPPPR